MYPTPILLAVSGGLDSVVMMHMMILASRKESIAVAHCNFQLRGEESDADEDFVRKIAESIGVQFYCQRFDTSAYAKDHGLGIQEAARNLRYDYFLKLKDEHGYACIATAHHKDDSIETFFINLLRGSGPEGLRGIQDDLQRGIIRPLMDMSRLEVIAYAKDHGITWREDSSNSSLKYLRNRIRHELVPLLDDLQPGWKKPQVRNMEIQAELAELVKANTEAYRHSCVVEKEEGLQITLDGRAGESLILGSLLAKFGFNYSQIKDILNSNESGSQVMAGSHTLTLHRGVLELTERTDRATGPWLVQEDLSCTHIPFDLRIELLSNVPSTVDQGPDVALIDTDRLKFPLRVRAWEAGDRLRPLGMQGDKKVSDLLNDHGLSVEQKKGVYVLKSAQDIVWVLGVRINENYKVRPDSKAVLKMYI